MTTPAIPTAVPARSRDRASTSRLFVTTATVNGVSVGEWDSMTGGATTAESTKHTVRGVRRVALGGPRDTEDVTLARPFVRGRDHDLARQLRTLAGLAEVTISRQPLDPDGRPFGRPELYTGVLRSVTYPDYSAEGNDVAMLELTVTVDGEVG